VKRSIVPIFIPHLGCPHICVFCDQKTSAAESAPAPERVLEMIKAGLGRASFPQIAFYGGSFTALLPEMQENYLKAAFLFVQRGLADSIRVSTRPDCVDEETVSRLLRFGVKTVELGVQSTDDRVLALCGRGHTGKDAVSASRIVKEAGLELILQMMPGLPGSSGESDRETARQLCRMRPDGVRIYPVCVLRGTPLAEWAARGEYAPMTVGDAVDLCSDLLSIFEEKDVPVIRVGLNPTPALSNGGVIAGAYHPAFGELASSRALRREAERLLAAMPASSSVTLTAGKGKLSQLKGQKKENELYLKRRFPHMAIAYAEDREQTAKVAVYDNRRGADCI